VFEIKTIGDILVLSFLAATAVFTGLVAYRMHKGYKEIWETTRLSTFEDRKAIRAIRRGEKILSRAFNDTKYAYNLKLKNIKTVEQYLNYATYDLLLTDTYIRQAFLMLIQTKNIGVDKLRAYYRSFDDIAIRDMILKSPKLSVEEKTMLALQK
jgi:hypothetical protein